MYKCLNCNDKFEEPDVQKTTYEDLYGVSSEFVGSTPLYIDICPNCGSDDIEEIKEEEDEVQ